jgi:hypothetical protein
VGVRPSVLPPVENEYWAGSRRAEGHTMVGRMNLDTAVTTFVIHEHET